jgi:hypothetical protein
MNGLHLVAQKLSSREGMAEGVKLRHGVVKRIFTGRSEAE